MLDRGKPAYARAYVHADPGGVLFCYGKARILKRLEPGVKRVLNELVHLLDFFFFYDAGRVEVRHLGGYAHGKVRGVELGYGPYAGLSGYGVPERLLPARAERRHYANACYNDSSFHGLVKSILPC